MSTETTVFRSHSISLANKPYKQTNKLLTTYYQLFFLFFFLFFYFFSFSFSFWDCCLKRYYCHCTQKMQCCHICAIYWAAHYVYPRYQQKYKATYHCKPRFQLTYTSQDLSVFQTWHDIYLDTKLFYFSCIYCHSPPTFVYRRKKREENEAWTLWSNIKWCRGKQFMQQTLDIVAVVAFV